MMSVNYKKILTPYSPRVKSGKCPFILKSVQQCDIPIASPTAKLYKGYSVQTLDQHRDLRVFLSTDLSWTAHYEKICCNAYRSLYLIRRSFSSALPVNLKHDLYLALVRSQLPTIHKFGDQN